MKSEWNEIMRVQCQSKTSRTPQIGKTWSTRRRQPLIRHIGGGVNRREDVQLRD